LNEIIVFSHADFPFTLYSLVHIIPLALFFCAAAAIYFFRRQLRAAKLSKLVRYTAAAILFLEEASYHIWSVYYSDWSLAFSLPLHLCGLSAMLSAVMLINRSYAIFEVVYFWGLAGASQALLTPDIGLFSFPHYLYYKFFLAHSMIILAVLYMVFVEGYRPYLKSIGKVFVVTNIYALVIADFNYFTGGNYLYLAHKPEGASLFDFLGPWPWYILWLEGLVLVSSLICYVPYIIQDMRNSGRIIIRSRYY
jgi:hypothetical integral membrane protein (TIGR02206 family)